MLSVPFAVMCGVRQGGILSVVSGHVLFGITRVLRSATPVPSVGALCFPNVFQKLLNALLFHFISANSVSNLRELYALYWCKFLMHYLRR